MWILSSVVGSSVLTFTDIATKTKADTFWVASLQLWKSGMARGSEFKPSRIVDPSRTPVGWRDRDVTTVTVRVSPSGVPKKCAMVSIAERTNDEGPCGEVDSTHSRGNPIFHQHGICRDFGPVLHELICLPPIPLPPSTHPSPMQGPSFYTRYPK